MAGWVKPRTESDLCLWISSAIPTVYFHKAMVFLSGSCCSKVWRSNKKHLEIFKDLTTIITTTPSQQPILWCNLRLSFQANSWGSKSLSGGTDCCKWMFTFIPQQLLLFVPWIRPCLGVRYRTRFCVCVWVGDAFENFMADGTWCVFSFLKGILLFKGSSL